MIPALARAKAVRIEDELSRRGVKLRRAGGEIVGPCPVCGGTDRFGVHLKKQVWNCRQCSKGGDVVALVQHLDGSDFRQAVRLLAGESMLRRQAPPRPLPEAPPEPENDKAAVARFLWPRSLPAAGTLVETYLRSRGCWGPSPEIRFLPGRAPRPPAMIARMGPNGVHLTKLAADGRGKAGTDKDKIMIGPSMGEPIVVQDNPERGELIVTEGIEDAASLALVTGWTAWAAGSAGRIHRLMKRAAGYDRLFFAVDHDAAGRAALARSQDIRPDVIPLDFAKILGIKERLDANKALNQYGPDALLAAVEWGEAQAAYRWGRMGFHAMQDALARANAVFTQMIA